MAQETAQIKIDFVDMDKKLPGKKSCDFKWRDHYGISQHNRTRREYPC